MFVIIVRYEKSLQEVEKHLEGHRQFLDQQYARGIFIASGRQEPRVGGVILADHVSRAELEQVLAEDPFAQHRVANFEIIEFEPTKYSADFFPLVRKL